VTLKDMREAANLSQKKLAHQIGYSTLTFGRWERGERTPPANVIPEIAKILNRSVDDVIKCFSNYGGPTCQYQKEKKISKTFRV
jgi:transcriptional regulator with XRE-family HTH domain